MLPAIIGAAGTLLGSGLSAIFANKTANKNIALNERLTQKQLDFADRQATIAYERQQSLMDKNNAYNDPTAQMARLKQAGLNPYLAYDNGNATIQASNASVQQASTPSAVAVPDYYANGTNILGNAFSSVFQNIAQIIRLKNETKIADAQAASLFSSAGYSTVQTEYARRAMPLQLDREQLQNDAITAGIEKSKVDKILGEAQVKLTETQDEHEKMRIIKTAREAVYQEVLNKYVDERQSAELSKILAEADLAAAQGDSVRVATSLQRFEAETRRISADASMRQADKETLEQFLTKSINNILSGLLGDTSNMTSSAVRQGFVNFGKSITNFGSPKLR